jgi:hypothetical protein
MLISMPTGTSTIFGVFQAILALLQKRDELPPAYKVARNQNFASEIFAVNCHNPWRVLLRCKLSVAAAAPFGQIETGSMTSPFFAMDSWRTWR